MYSLPTDDFRQYINGELVSGRGRTTQIRCPGNGEPVAQIALATKEQAQQALEAARDAFPGWSALTLEERGAWMMKLRDAIQRESENLLNLLMLESGKLRSHAAFETGSLTGYLSFFLEQAKSEHTQGIRDAAGGKNMFLAVREPVGVVVAALAWNFPMHNLATKLGPILASGCTAVIKPATKTPLSTLYFGEILHRIGFPKGVINFVAGDAREIGTTLCESPRHDHHDRLHRRRSTHGTGFYHQRKAFLHGTRGKRPCHCDSLRRPERRRGPCDREQNALRGPDLRGAPAGLRSPERVPGISGDVHGNCLRGPVRHAG